MLHELKPPEIRQRPDWLKPEGNLTLRYSHVYHVGGLEGEPQQHGNMEGPLLSVSLHPEQWRKHAGLGSQPVWKLRKKSGPILLLDLERFHWKKPHPHALWGIHEGLIVQDAPLKFSMTPKLREFWHQRQQSDWNMHDPRQVEIAVLSAALCFMHKSREESYDGLWWKSTQSPVCPFPRGGLVPQSNLLCDIRS
jgi:hypothetical protein